MLGIVATLRVKPGMEKEFEAVATELVAKVRANEPGCALYALHRRGLAGVRQAEAFIWLGAVLGGRLLSLGLKEVFQRERPPVVHRLVPVTAASPTGGASSGAGPKAAASTASRGSSAFAGAGLDKRSAMATP